MIEKHLTIDDTDPALLYGAGNANMQMLKALFPKLRIVARGSVVKVMGDDETLDRFAETLTQLQEHCNRYNSLTPEDVVLLVRGEKTQREGVQGIICYSIQGKPITARSENQQKLVDAFAKNDMVFAVGPAGSGKTYISIALAVKALKNKEVRRIILSRPAVEAGEKLGFLPGDMREKIDPYLQPLYDALEDMIQPQKLQEYMETGVVQIAPLAFMRGRTLSDAIVILDEAQNTTVAQMKMFLTRLGFGSKMIITGDRTQIDLPHNVRSGLTDALQTLSNVEEIKVVEMNQKDIVRHKLVTKIVKAYELSNYQIIEPSNKKEINQEEENESTDKN